MKRLCFLAFVISCGILFLFWRIRTFSSDKAVTAIQFVSSSEMSGSSLEREVAVLSLEQKIGQLMMVSIPGTSLSTTTAHWLRTHHTGGVILLGKNVTSAAQVRKFIVQLRDNAVHAGDPLPLVGVDQEGGIVSRFLFLRERTAQKDIMDADSAFRVGLRRGNELRSLGVNVNFSPVLDVADSSRDFMFSRTFRGDPGKIAQLGAAMIRGYEQAGIISVAKHFPGHGGTAVDSHKELPIRQVTYPELARDLRPFQSALRLGVPMVMVGHIQFPRIDHTYPASISPVIIGKILRNGLGYQGVAITDDLGMGALMRTHTLGDAGVQAIKAGEDILLVVRSLQEYDMIYTRLMSAVRHEEITAGRLDESVRRILLLKEKIKTKDFEVK